MNLAGDDAASRRAATAISAIAGMPPGAASVVVDDDDPSADEDGVDLAQRRGEHPDGAVEQRILATASNEAGK